MKFHSDFPYTMHRIWKDTRSKELRNILQREPSWIHSRLWLKTCLKVLLLQREHLSSHRPKSLLQHLVQPFRSVIMRASGSGMELDGKHREWLLTSLDQEKYIKQWSISFAMKKSHLILAFYLLLTNKKIIHIITNGN